MGFRNLILFSIKLCLSNRVGGLRSTEIGLANVVGAKFGELKWIGHGLLGSDGWILWKPMRKSWGLFHGLNRILDVRIMF